MAASEFRISMSALVKSILRLRIVLDPLKQISADLNKAKEVLALIHDIVLFLVLSFLVSYTFCQTTMKS